MGLNAIEDYSLGVAGGFTQPIDPTLVPSVTNYLSVLGAVGMTAYFGFLEVHGFTLASVDDSSYWQTDALYRSALVSFGPVGRLNSRNR